MARVSSGNFVTVAAARWLLGIVAFVAPSAARGQEPVLPKGDRSAGGWVVIDAGASAPKPVNPAVPPSRFALVHLPPSLPRGGGAADLGAVRLASWLASAPAAMASCGNRVYLVFGASGGTGWGTRPVLSVGAEPTG